MPGGIFSSSNRQIDVTDENQIAADLDAAEAARDESEDYAEAAHSWADGTQPVEANPDVEYGTSTNNAKYWAEQAEMHGQASDVDIIGGTNITVTENGNEFTIDNDITAGSGVELVSGQIRLNADLSDINGVAVSNPIDNQFLRHNGNNWVNETVELDGLNDVSISSPSNDQILRYDGSNWVNETLAASEGLVAGNGIDIDGNTHTISIDTGDIDLGDLNDVQANSPNDNQYLRYNNGSWSAQDIPAGHVVTGGTGIDITNDVVSLDANIGELSDVSVSNPADNEFLRYDGTNWVNEAVTPSDPASLNNVGDVNYTGNPADDQFLRFDGTNWTNEAVTIPTNLSGLSDATVTSPQDLQFLRYNQQANAFVNESVTIPANLDDLTNRSINDLTDVAATNAQDNEVLTFDSQSGHWQAQPAASQIDSLGDITDVSISNPTDNQYLRYDGTNWINESVSGDGSLAAGTGISITDDTVSLNANINLLTDVTITSPTDNQFLRHNGSEWVNETVDVTHGLTAGNGIDITNDDTISVDFSDGTLNSLGGVTITSPEDNEYLRFDGTNWVNEAVSTTISDNTDVVVSDPQDNEFLRYNGSNWVNEAVTVPSNLTSLSDVTVSSPADNQFLRHNGSQWVNESVTIPTTINNLTDVTVTSPTDNQFLRHNGTAWVNESVTIPANLGDLGNRSIGNLSDVSVSSPTDNEFLRYDGSNWTNESVSIPTNLNSLTDVSIASPSDNQFLRHNGTNWVNETVDLTTYTEGSGIDISNTDEISVDLTELSFNFSDVDTSGATNGQVLTYDGSEWIPQISSGGVTDNSRLSIALSPSSLDEGDGNTTITVTLSISNALSGETISAQSVTVTDPTGHTVSVSGSANTWTFTANGTNTGNYVVRANATFTISGTSSPHSATRNLPVHASNSNWYASYGSSVPANNAAMTDLGTFNGSGNHTFTTTGDASERGYLALPTGSYTFATTSAGFPHSVPTVITEGYTQSGYTLYEMSTDDVDPNQTGTTIIYVTEN